MKMELLKKSQDKSKTNLKNEKYEQDVDPKQLVKDTFKEV